MIKSFWLPFFSILMLGLASYHVARTSQAQPPLSPPSSPARAPYGRQIGASGVIEPRSENISMGAHVPGVVEAVYVNVGDRVTKGDRLFELDVRPVRAELLVKEAMLAASQAQLARLEAMPRAEEIPPSEANVNEAAANVARVADLEQRGRKLLAGKFITAEDMVGREQNLRMVQHQLQKTKAEHELLLAGAWEQDKAVAKAAVAQAASEVERLRVEIDRHTVKASVDGEILQVNVRPGEYVSLASGKALVVLGNVSLLHVRVDIDEQDIPRFERTLGGIAYLRADSSKGYPLAFVRVEPYVIPKKSLTGDVTERVDTRVLQVIYALDQKGDQVYVGQQVDVFFDLDSGKAAVPTGEHVPPATDTAAPAAASSRPL
jgi:HlyD family secretion protein